MRALQTMAWSNPFLDRHSNAFIWAGLALLVAMYLSMTIAEFREQPPPHHCSSTPGTVSALHPYGDLAICD